MKVITIATDLANSFLQRLLIPSCHAAGLDLVILHPTRPLETLKDKRTIVTSYLTGNGSPPDELVLFTDAYDTLFLHGEEYIRERCERFAQGVVFSAELNSWPLGTLGFLLQDNPVRPYPYLNSGGFVGPASDLLALLTKYPVPPSDHFPLVRQLRAHDFDVDQRFGFSDQYYWVLVQLVEPELVGVDHHAVLFENYAPPVGDVWSREFRSAVSDFQARGVESDSYRRERARLVELLRSPSDAAQVHFGSPITKAVVLDLLAEELLPDWLCAPLSPRPGQPSVQVQEIRY